MQRERERERERKRERIANDKSRPPIGVKFYASAASKVEAMPET